MLYNFDEKNKRPVDLVLQTLSFENELDEDDAIMFMHLSKDGCCAMNFDNASINDLILMRGHLDLSITRRYLETNYPSVINDENLNPEEDEDLEV